MKTELDLRVTGRIYGAYGSNLHVEQMLKRCPGAARVGAAWLEDHRLVFRSVADVEFHAGSRVPIGLWRLTASDERALDRYEGVKHGIYERVFLPVRTSGGIEQVLIYRMCGSGYAAPPEPYFERILKGYAAWDFDEAIVTGAALASAASFT